MRRYSSARAVFDHEVSNRDGSVSVVYRRNDGSFFRFEVPARKKSETKSFAGPVKARKFLPTESEN